MASPFAYLSLEEGAPFLDAVNGLSNFTTSGVQSFDLRVDSAQARVDTLGRVTQVMVVALSENGRVRSRPSNKLSLAPADD